MQRILKHPDVVCLLAVNDPQRNSGWTEQWLHCSSSQKTPGLSADFDCKGGLQIFE